MERSVRRVIGGVLLALLACAPEEDPVRTSMPPRTLTGTEVRHANVGADSVQSATYVRDARYASSERAFFGAWAGARARALFQFDRDAFEADTLAGATISNAKLSFQCAPGQGDSADIHVALAGIVPGAAGAWSADSVSWPGPAIDDRFIAETIVENCAAADTFPERNLTVPDALVAAWIADPAGENGLSLTVSAGSAMLALASSENTFLYFDASSIVRQVAKPRLIFSATKPGSSPFTMTIPAADLTDTYVVAPDSAVVGSAPEEALIIAKGPFHRMLLRTNLPVLPLGSGIHRATIVLHALGHPRRDRAIELQVFRLTSTWPAGAPVDSLVTDDGVVWHAVELAEDADSLALPITDLVQAWVDGTEVNNGVLVRAGKGGEDFAAAAFASGAHPNPALRPRLEITYTVPIGGRP